MKTKISLCIAMIALCSMAFAQPGDLDSTFNAAGSPPGKINLQYGFSSYATAMAVDQSGRSYVVSDLDVNYSVVTRLHSDGTVDSTFGPLNNGIVTLGAYALRTYDLIIHPGDGSILIAGSAIVAGNGDMMVVKMDREGYIDSSFSGDGYAVFDFGTPFDEAKRIAIHPDGSIIMAGTANFRTTVAKIDAFGNQDTTFGVSGKFQSVDSTEYVSGLKVNPFSGNIFVAGDSYNGNYNGFVFCLRPDGNAETGFGNIAGTGKTQMSFGIPTSISDIELLPNGDLLVGGNNGGSFMVISLRSNGYPELSFGGQGTGAFKSVSLGSSNLTNILYSTQGIFLTGSGGFSAPLITIMKIDHSGIIDSTFGVGGIAIPAGSGNISSSDFSGDNGIILAGVDASPGTCILKVTLKVNAYIYGNEYVLAGTAEKYEVVGPPIWGPNYIYTWNYLGTGALIAGATGDKGWVVFEDTASSGTLQCQVRNPSGILVAVLDIYVNVTGQTNSDGILLTEVMCPREISYSSTCYIDGFTINNLSVDSTKYSDNGYSDLTLSGYYDTLHTGGNYTARMNLVSDTFPVYGALWVDYNNDGYFTSDEFAGQGLAMNSDMIIQGLYLKNSELQVGAKRLRVRVKAGKDFAPDEGCQGPGEIGETEDYLIIMHFQDFVEAPEIITPNEDGKNDFFVVKGVDPKKGNKFTVFDRWGTVKFTSENYENDWSGIDNKGEKLSQGTYFYTFTDGSDENSIKGFLEIRY